MTLAILMNPAGMSWFRPAAEACPSQNALPSFTWLAKFLPAATQHPTSSGRRHARSAAGVNQLAAPSRLAQASASLQRSTPARPSRMTASIDAGSASSGRAARTAARSSAHSWPSRRTMAARLTCAAARWR
ncbi:Uncharacterised protein [Bordetella pertussis]|nr:Uncharacterised protein [Bordetella pertussis]